MKKTVSIILTFLCLAALLTPLTAFAEDERIVVAEDFESLTYDGKKYLIYNGEDVYGSDYKEDVNVEVVFEDEDTDVKYCYVSYDGKKEFSIDFCFSNNSRLTCYYLEETAYADYKAEVESGKALITLGSFYKTAETTLDLLMGETVILKSDELSAYVSEAVYSHGEYMEHYGCVLYKDNEFYYAANEENGGTVHLNGGVDIVAHEIMDESIIDKLDKLINPDYEEESYDNVYDDDYDDQSSDGETGLYVITAVFLLFVFAVIPFGIMIFALISMLRKNCRYKKVYAFVMSVSALILAVVTVIVTIIASAN